MNAGRIARAYRWLEYGAFGRTLERCRYSLVPYARNAARILIAGEGDGRFLQQVAAANPTAEITVIELSDRMIELARSPHGIGSRVQFRHEDIRNANLTLDDFDVIATPFLLDCFDEPDCRRVIAKLHAALRRGGVWLVAEFDQPQAGLARVHAAVWLWTMYWFFAVSTGLRTRSLPPYQNLLAANGMRREEHRSWRAGLITAQVWRKPS